MLNWHFAPVLSPASPLQPPTDSSVGAHHCPSVEAPQIHGLQIPQVPETNPWRVRWPPRTHGPWAAASPADPSPIPPSGDPASPWEEPLPSCDPDESAASPPHAVSAPRIAHATA